MFGILGFLGFGYLVIKFGKPFHMASIYCIGGLLFSLLGEGNLLSSAVACIFLFAYTALTYFFIERYNDDIFAPIGILLTGTIILTLSIFA